MGSSLSSQSENEGPKGIPPGPWNPLTILGISKSPSERLTDMSYHYGPVFSFRMIGAPLTVVLNNHRVIEEALIGNADAFPTRVTSPLRHQWGTRGRIFYSHGEDQVAIRQFVYHGLKMFQEGVLFVKVSEEARHLCDAFGKDDSPIEPTHLLTLASGNIMSILNFGKRYDYNDQNIIQLMESFDYLHLALDPTNPVHQFPWLYETFWYRKLKQSQEFVRDFIQDEIKEHQANFDPDHPKDFIDLYLKRITKDDDLFLVERAWYTIKDVFSSSSNPTAAGLQWMIALICQHQDMQQKILEEVEAVIGLEKLPAFEDLHKMPFTHAFMKEILRYRTVVPFGTREVVRDVTINGYHIPKGSRVYLNYWAAERDPDLWHNPDQFMPERFLSSDGKTVLKHKHHIPLGIGHRDCMGQTMALMEMFLFGTNLLQKYHLKFSPDEPPPSLRGICGTVVVAEQFKLIATKRN